MASFNINISNINKNINEIKSKVSSYRNSINNLKNNLVNIDTCWRDLNTERFINVVKTENSLFLDHADTINKYLDSITIFLDSLSSIIRNKMNIQNISKLSYNSDILAAQIKNLKDSCVHFDYCINLMNEMIIPETFEYKSLLNIYKEDLKKYRDSIDYFSTRLENINNEIIKLISETQNSINMIDFVSIDNEEMQYNWKTYGTKLNSLEMENQDRIYSSNTNVNKVDISTLKINQQNKTYETSYEDNLVVDRIIINNKKDEVVINSNNQSNLDKKIETENFDEIEIKQRDINNIFENDKTASIDLNYNKPETNINNKIENDNDIMEVMNDNKNTIDYNLNKNKINMSYENVVNDRNKVNYNVSNQDKPDINLNGVNQMEQTNKESYGIQSNINNGSQITKIDVNNN